MVKIKERRIRVGKIFEINSGFVVFAFLLFLGLGVSKIHGEEQSKKSPKKSEETQQQSSALKNQKLQNHLLENVDIFGKTNMPSVFILGLGPSVDPEVEKELLTRDFTRDAFFMQNVDREQFELRTGYSPELLSNSSDNKKDEAKEK